MKIKKKMNDFEKYQKIEALNASLIKHFVDSERQGLQYFLNPPEPTQAMINGQAFHSIIESDLRGVEIPKEFVNFSKLEKEVWGENPNRRKKDYQEWKNDLLLSGAKFYDENIEIAADYLINSSIYKYLKKLSGEPEKNLTATTKVLNWEGDDEIEIVLKGRTDYLIENKQLIVDWKTISEMPTEKILKYQFWKMKYNMQAGIYVKLAELVFGKKFDFLFVFVQSKEPYEIATLLIRYDEAITMYEAITHILYRVWNVIFENKPARFIYENQQNALNKIGAFFLNL